MSDIDYRNKFKGDVTGYENVRQSLGNPGVYERAAKAIIKRL